MALRVDLHFPDVTGVDGLFEVHRTDFTDALSELFVLDVVAFSPQPDIDPKSLLGQAIEVHFRDEAQLPSVFGIVRQARRHAAEKAGVTEYRLAVAPREWLLTRARQTCIYQQKSGPEIAREVLARHGPRMRLPAPLPAARAREYCVQYGEADHDFVFRALAEDGVATLFDHKNGGAWRLTSDTAGGSIQVDADIPFNPANLTPGGAAVLRWVEIADIETARVTRRDYDFTKPGFTLQATEAASGTAAAEASLEDYAYATGVFATDPEGKDLVNSRLGAMRASSRRLRLTTNFAMGAGSRFHVSGPDIDGDWVVIRAHSVLESDAGGRTQHAHELLVIPADTPFRPKPWPKPRVHGVQTAFVVGDTPAGTVDADEYGRIKLELRWDRRDLGKGNPTRWVRVAQAWAGPGYGLVTLPRIGDEVLVAYSEGDPDLPLVVGRVHDAVSATPLSLPVPDKTKAIWKSQSFGPGGPVEGFNMIMMDDAAGAEVVEVRAQLDYRERIERDMSSSVGRNRAAYVQGDDATEIEGSQSLVVHGSSGSRTTGGVSMSGGSIQMSSGSTMKLHAKGDMTLSTDADRTDKTASNHFIDTGSLYITAKDVVQINAAHFHVFATGDIRLICGGSSIVISDGGIKITSSGDVEVNGGLVKLNCG